MNEIDRIVAIEAIKRLKARYFRCFDSKDWSGFEAVFARDARFDISDDLPGCIVTGAAEILKTARAGIADGLSVHHGHCPEIDITSENSATGIWAMEDMLRWPEGSAAPLKSLHGYGHYFETYRRVGGKWVIESLKLKRLRVDHELRHPA